MKCGKVSQLFLSITTNVNQIFSEADYQPALERARKLAGSPALTRMDKSFDSV